VGEHRKKDLEPIRGRRGAAREIHAPRPIDGAGHTAREHSVRILSSDFARSASGDAGTSRSSPPSASGVSHWARPVPPVVKDETWHRRGPRQVSPADDSTSSAQALRGPIPFPPRPRASPPLSIDRSPRPSWLTVDDPSPQASLLSLRGWRRRRHAQGWWGSLAVGKAAAHSRLSSGRSPDFPTGLFERGGRP